MSGCCRPSRETQIALASKASKSLRGFAAAAAIACAGSALHADPLTSAINQTLLGGLLQGDIVGIDVDSLNPVGTGDNDTLGLDLFTPENGLGTTLSGSEILGFGSTTGSAISLDPLGLPQLTQTLGLAWDSPIVTALRNTLGPEGALIVPIVDGTRSLADLANASLDLSGAVTLPGLGDQAIGLSILGEDSSGNATAGGLAGVALLTPGASGNGGLIGLAVMSGDNAGNGDLAGISLIGGDNSGSGALTGVAILSGDNAATSQAISIGTLNGDNAGNADLLGIAALNGDNSGNGGFAGISAINGANSGNANTLAVATLSGADSGNSEAIATGILNGSNSGNAGLTSVSIGNADRIDPGNDPSTQCEGLGCGDSDEAPLSTLCAEGDADGDGVCNDEDDCPGTPTGESVYSTGCHLAIDNPLVLRGVNFEFDSTIITQASRPLLFRAREIIAENPDTLIAIDGHTDSKGSDAYNQRLSHRRASAILDYFVANGIDAERLVARGFGESQPMVPNTTATGADDPEGRSLNRRVELTVVNQETLARIPNDNKQREQAEREARRQSIQRQQRERQAATEAREQQRKADRAEGDYEAVLDFLEESGTAER